MPARPSRTEKIDLRVAPEQKASIVAAARTTGQSVSSFVLESALVRAMEALPERRSFLLTAVQWEAFMAALDAPPRELPHLRRILDEPSIFETPDSR